jgi:hypothetical protein
LPLDAVGERQHRLRGAIQRAGGERLRHRRGALKLGPFDIVFLAEIREFCGRFIIQYLDSSAGMVQPTLMVGIVCACAAPVSAPAARVAAISHFEEPSFMPAHSV